VRPAQGPEFWGPKISGLCYINLVSVRLVGTSVRAFFLECRIYDRNLLLGSTLSFSFSIFSLMAFFFEELSCIVVFSILFLLPLMDMSIEYNLEKPSRSCSNEIALRAINH
jgi:hypothetical protein